MTCAAAALSEFWRGVIRNYLKRRSKSKRTPSDGKVNAALLSLGRDQFVLPLVSALRDVERRIGKSARNWSASERRDAASDVCAVLEEMRLRLQKGRGRPRKARGIILTEMPPGTSVRTRRKVPEHVVRVLLPYMRGALLGAWEKRYQATRAAEGLVVESRQPSAVIADIRSWDSDPNNVMNPGRVPRGAWSAFIEEFSLDPRLTNALKQKYSRLQKKG